MRSDGDLSCTITLTQVLCSNCGLPGSEVDSKVAFNPFAVDAGELLGMIFFAKQNMLKLLLYLRIFPLHRSGQPVDKLHDAMCMLMRVQLL